MAKTSGIILKTIAPVVIGLAVVAWLFARELSIEREHLACAIHIVSHICDML